MAEPGTKKTAEPSMHVCPACGSELVQPLSWEQEDDRAHWRVQRRCPECEWTCASIHDEAAIDDFDERLDRGSRELAAQLRALERANMSTMAEAFVRALDRDLITADDFRVSPGPR